MGPFEEKVPAGKLETTAWDLDGDGKLSPKELTNWRENGNGKDIQVDASKINIGYIETKGLEKNQTILVNLLTQLTPEGRVYGHLYLTYDGNGGFSIAPNKNDYEVGSDKGFPWSDFPIRNTLTRVGQLIDGGTNGGIDFNIYFRGTVYPRKYRSADSNPADAYKFFDY